MWTRLITYKSKTPQNDSLTNERSHSVPYNHQAGSALRSSSKKACVYPSLSRGSRSSCIPYLVPMSVLEQRSRTESLKKALCTCDTSESCRWYMDFGNSVPVRNKDPTRNHQRPVDV